MDDSGDSRASRRAQLMAEIKAHGGGVGKASAKLRGTKRSRNTDYGKARADESPIERQRSMIGANWMRKVDAPHAGDHSPSVSAVNDLPKRQVGITGRASHKQGNPVDYSERKVPTLQFQTESFDGADGQRDPVKGSAAHTMLTTMREQVGAGEKHSLPDFDTLLDTTHQAYSPYRRTGEPVYGGVDMHRVDVFAEADKPDAPGPSVLHTSKKGVAPIIAQAMVNMWYRGGGRVQGPGGGTGSASAVEGQPPAKRRRKAATHASGPAPSLPRASSVPALTPPSKTLASASGGRGVKRSASQRLEPIVSPVRGGGAASPVPAPKMGPPPSSAAKRPRRDGDSH